MSAHLEAYTLLGMQLLWVSVYEICYLGVHALLVVFALPWFSSTRISPFQTYVIILRRRLGFRARSSKPFHAYRISCIGMCKREWKYALITAVNTWMLLFSLRRVCIMAFVQINTPLLTWGILCGPSNYQMTAIITHLQNTHDVYVHVYTYIYCICVVVHRHNVARTSCHSYNICRNLCSYVPLHPTHTYCDGHHAHTDMHSLTHHAATNTPVGAILSNVTTYLTQVVAY